MTKQQAIQLLTLLAQAMQVTHLDSYSFFTGNGPSANKKTGPITNIYTSSNSCPERCPMKALKVCYAKTGPCSWQWKKADGTDKSNGQFAKPITELGQHLKAIATTELIRHNVAGDLAIPGTSEINPALVLTLVKAFKGHKAYTYTHCTINENNANIVKLANTAGFSINFSCETVAQVQKAIALGCPAVLAAETMERKSAVVDGTNFKRCPATFENSSVTCASCKKCANCKRNYAIVFPVHGTESNVKKAKQAHFLTNI